MLKREIFHNRFSVLQNISKYVENDSDTCKERIKELKTYYTTYQVHMRLLAHVYKSKSMVC